MIAIYGRKSEGGILITICAGGEGTSAPKSEEHKRKIAESNTGVPRSAKTKKRMSVSASGNPKSLQHRKNIGAALKGKPWSPKRRKAYEQKKQSLSQ